MKLAIHASTVSRKISTEGISEGLLSLCQMPEDQAQNHITSCLGVSGIAGVLEDNLVLLGVL